MKQKILISLAILLSAPAAARADVALGPFLGYPTGLDVKFGLGDRSSLDLLLGWYSFRGLPGDAYGHLTYLVTPVVGHGESVLVPLRLGIGGAVFGNSNNIDVGVRFPLEVGLKFRTAPLEIYGEIALLLAFDHHVPYDFADLQGGIGLRFYL